MGVTPKERGERTTVARHLEPRGKTVLRRAVPETPPEPNRHPNFPVM